MIRDVIVNAVTSLLGVLILFVIAFRRVSLVGYAFLPLAVGLILGFGLPVSPWLAERGPPVALQHCSWVLNRLRDRLLRPLRRGATIRREPRPGARGHELDLGRAVVTGCRHHCRDVLRV